MNRKEAVEKVEEIAERVARPEGIVSEGVVQKERAKAERESKKRAKKAK